MKIRLAQQGDAAVITECNVRLAKETEGLALDPAVVAAGVAALLKDPLKGLYYLAEEDGVIAGQLMVTYEWSDWRNGVFWWIQSVYVTPDARRSGVFRALYGHVEQLARATAGVCGLRLYVENDNIRAQQTYLGCGMVNAGYVVMETDYSGAVKRTGDH